MKHYLILFILIVSGLLLFYRLSELLFFIGDVGWFYLSARDLITTGNIPLVGIPSSHPWLHQGPLWTYLLAAGLLIFRFDPVAGGVIGVLFGLGSIYLIYRVGKELFSEQVGLLSALLYGLSPLVIIHARMPYHTAPIPFFTLLLIYAVIRFIHGNPYYFALSLFSISLLYNFELATVIYGFLLIGVLVYGIYKKQSFITGLKNRKVLLVSFFSFIIPLIPILIHDTQNGFPQTLKFAAWMGYKVLTIFGYPKLHPEIPSATYGDVFAFLFSHLQTLLFLPNFGVSLLFFCAGLITVFYEVIRNKKDSSLLLGLFLLVGFGGYIAAKTTSEAYLPMLFPLVFLSLALFFSKMFAHRYVRFIAVGLLIIVVLGNSYALLDQNYLMGKETGGYGPTFIERRMAAEQIVKEAGENKYTIKGRGPGSQFDGFIMPYIYLTWWKGHGPDKKGEVHFLITETTNTVLVEKL